MLLDVAAARPHHAVLEAQNGGDAAICDVEGATPEKLNPLSFGTPLSFSCASAIAAFEALAKALEETLFVKRDDRCHSDTAWQPAVNCTGELCPPPSLLMGLIEHLLVYEYFCAIENEPWFEVFFFPRTTVTSPFIILSMATRQHLSAMA